MVLSEKITAGVMLSDGTTFGLYENSILDASISSQCIPSSGFSFGGVCSATLNMTFLSNLTSRYQLVGAKVHLSIYKGGAWQSFGVYNITSASRWKNKFTISASDNIIWLDKSVYSTDENMHKINEITSRLQGSVDIYSALYTIIEVSEQHMAQSYDDIVQLPGGDLSTTVFQEVTTDCPRDWLSWGAEFLCGFAIADAGGNVKIEQFETSPTAVITQSMVQTETTDIADFTLALVGARMEVWDTTMGAVWYPDLENLPNSIFLDVTENWLIQGKHYLYGQAMDILDNMTNAIGSIPYRPFSATVHSDVLYHLGQCVQLEDSDGNYYNSVITHYDWSLHGGQVIKCAGEDTRLLADTKRRTQVKRVEEKIVTKMKNLNINVKSENEIKSLAEQGKLVTGTIYYDISGDENV